MHIYTHELVLEAVFFDRLSVLIVLLLLLVLGFLFEFGVRVILLRFLLLFFLEPLLLVHDFVVAVGFQVQHRGELKVLVKLIVLESVK